MRVYVAAPWVHKEAARATADYLAAAGHQVVSRWLREHADSTDPAELRQEAQNDVQDLYDAQVVVLLNLCKSDGKACEMGMAYMLSKPIIVVGGTTGNVFYHLPEIIHVATVEETLPYLQ